MDTQLLLPLHDELYKKLNIINDRLKSIEALDNIEYKTNGRFRYNPSNEYSGVDIHTTISLESIINVKAFIDSKEADYNGAAAALGLSSYPLFKWQGFPADAWAHDLQARTNMIMVKEKKDALLNAKNKLSEFIPQDIKLKALLEGLQFLED